MEESLGKIWQQIKHFFNSLSAGRKVATILTSLLVVFGLVTIFYWASHRSYQSLMSHLSPKDSTAIIRILREKKIPFQVSPDGKVIKIPPESVYDLRLELATMGLPETSTVGYEVFDHQGLGMTSFVQKINRQRALEGELMRTINSMKGIQKSRVHLVIPDISPFIEEEKKATASVILDLDPGFTLLKKQVFGISKLVSSAIEGLDVSQVVILDSSGKVLSNNQQDPFVQIVAEQHDYRRKAEEETEKKIVHLLEPVVGKGKVVARVSMKMDFSRVEETQKLYDPDSAAVVSEQKEAQTSAGTRPVSMGKPGAATNLPGQPNPPGGVPQVRQNTKKNRQTTNYRIPQTIRHVQKPFGMISKLNVAVLLDGKEVKQTDKKTGKVLSKVIPWTPKELNGFKKIVSKAVGIDPKRGDALDLEYMKFRKISFVEAEKLAQLAEKRRYIQKMVVYAVMAVIILCFFLFVVRPFIKWITENTIESVDSFLPQTLEELEKMQKAEVLPGLEETMPVLPERVDPEKVEGEMIKEKIITLIDQNPHKASLILSDWIGGEGGEKRKGQEKSTA